MKVVFIITSFWAYGELIIAKEFAEELRKNGFDIIFVIPPTHKESIKESGFRHIMLIPKSKKLNQIIFQEISENFKPNLVILSDFLNYSFAEKHYGIVRADLEIFKCKLATFDNFDWQLSRKCMDTYGFVSDIPKKTNILDYGKRIIPCPLSNPLQELDKDTYKYSLVTERLNNSNEYKEILKKKYGFDKIGDKKIILVSYAKWQESYINNKNISDFIDLSNKLFDELIISLAKDYIIICIGINNNKFKECENIFTYNSMISKEFDEYAVISDLYIGKNITSTSMVRLALSGIICVNIINSYVSKYKIKEKSFNGFNYESQLSEMSLYNYMMYPVGWYYFLKPLFDNNLYGEIIQNCEQFEMNETRNKIIKLLNLEEKQIEIGEKVSKLNKILDKLDTPSMIVEAIIKE